MEACPYLLPKVVVVISCWFTMAAVFLDMSFTTKRLVASAAVGDVTNGTHECRDGSLCESSQCSCNTSDAQKPRPVNLTQGSDLASILSATSPVGFVSGGTTVDVVVCSRCLADDREENITALGLIICVVTENNTCTDCKQENRTLMTVDSFSSFPTWAVAAMSSFKAEYRATPDNWHRTIADNSGTTIFTLGANANCNSSQLTDYCNGPLPSDVDITISIIKCAGANCACLTFKDVFTTKARNIPTFNTVGFGIGVALGGAVVLTAVIMTLVICLTDRQSQTGTEVKASQEVDQKDIHHDISTIDVSGESNTSSATIVSSCSGAAMGTATGTEGIGRSSSGGRVSFKSKDDKTSEDDNEVVVVSEEVIEVSKPESAKQESQGRRGSRKMSLTTLM